MDLIVSNEIPQPVALAAAVALKNYIKENWVNLVLFGLPFTFIFFLRNFSEMLYSVFAFIFSLY